MSPEHEKKIIEEIDKIHFYGILGPYGISAANVQLTHLSFYAKINTCNRRQTHKPFRPFPQLF